MWVLLSRSFRISRWWAKEYQNIWYLNTQEIVQYHACSYSCILSFVLYKLLLGATTTSKSLHQNVFLEASKHPRNWCWRADVCRIYCVEHSVSNWFVFQIFDKRWGQELNPIFDFSNLCNEFLSLRWSERTCSHSLWDSNPVSSGHYKRFECHLDHQNLLHVWKYLNLQALSSSNSSLSK